ncbi:unnamed protein product, partial [Rotaria sp. Silwood2]
MIIYFKTTISIQRNINLVLHLLKFLDREKVLSDLATDPRSVLSPMDSEIQLNSDRLIAILPSASDMINST